ncbi:TRAP-type C4-dicarboxylate transport system, small permease component [Tistlia consotensis]|uniref:TRAP transporter small permease protein n=1 Tax=Tistlia consotensis USBA 355 TaxID=560819 RepID=A0A1Y6CBI5_9PROT|nr:TRAP transporter small permease subunit [Tistlia consotensis]SMF55471.1 TRAP-type C4-dicarboxylate transport system, small permease component [Tistlia consotensis USBA 355]SNR88504.1 TRAP-type C4-dicarboxylate transport system, small permease component [Tistlia consotensis]
MAYAHWHARTDRVLCVVENVAAVAAGAVLVAIMVLVSLDAILRHAFAAPLTFQLTLTEDYLLVAMVLLALPWGYRKGGAIQVRLLLDSCPAAFNQMVIRLGLLAAAVYLAALAWFSWGRFLDALVNDEVTMGVIDWPVDWSWVWVPLGLGLLALRVLLDAVAPTLKPIGSDHEVEEGPEHP